MKIAADLAQQEAALRCLQGVYVRLYACLVCSCPSPFSLFIILCPGLTIVRCFVCGPIESKISLAPSAATNAGYTRAQPYCAAFVYLYF
jgi:hypothetical protein